MTKQPPARRPTAALTQAVQQLAPWKLTVMFVFGLLGASAVLVRTFVLDAGHEHAIPELIASGVAFVTCVWLVFPVGVTQALDKFLPAKWRGTNSGTP